MLLPPRVPARQGPRRITHVLVYSKREVAGQARGDDDEEEEYLAASSE